MKHVKGQFLVYLAICAVTSLPYVGIVYGKNQTVAHRWQEHCNPCKSIYNRRLERAIREHGPENFKVEIIDKADDRATLTFKEKFYTGLYDSYRNGYNGTAGGSWVPTERSAEWCRKISEAKRGKPLSEEHIRSLRAVSIGRRPSEQQLSKLHDANRGKQRSKDTCRKISQALQGRRKGRPWSDARRAAQKTGSKDDGK